MSIVGTFTIPAESFALDHSLSTVPEMTLQAEQLASHSSLEVLPFLWATGGDFGAFHEALEDDPTITDVDIAEETDGEVLYRLEWSDDFCDLINEMVDLHAAIVEAKAREEEWHLRLRFSEERMVSSFQDHFRETEHRFEVNHLSRQTDPRQREYGLTEEQYEALVSAVQNGYFEVPRTTSVDQLGESLDISANSVSQRLRRGCQTLIRNTLEITDDE